MNSQTIDKRTSAHQLWVDIINETVKKTMLPKTLQKKAYGFMTSKLQLEQTTSRVLDIITEFENTRLRVVVDGIIKELDDATAELAAVKDQHAKTHRLNFVRKRRLQQLSRAITAKQEAIQKILLIVVNTPPPPQGKSDEAPKLTVEKGGPGQ